MDAHNERSKLVGRQKQDRVELEKKVKKSKGAMKEAAQKELDDLEKKHEAELASFDASEGTGKEKVEKEPAPAAALDIDVSNLRERHWNGLSKKELEECCKERGLGKTGSKEELTVKLINFHADLQIRKKEEAMAAAAAAAAAEEEDEEEEEVAEKKKKKDKKEKKAKKEKKKKEEDEEEEDEEVAVGAGEGAEEEVEEEEEEEVTEKKKKKKDKKEKKARKEVEEEEEEEEEEKAPAKSKKAADDDEDSDEDDDDGLDIDAEEMERQHKRETAVRQAVRYLLTKKFPEGFPLSEFVEKLESINVKGFDPEKLGYKSIPQFVRRQPPNVLLYDKEKKFIGPPRKKNDDA